MIYDYEKSLEYSIYGFDDKNVTVMQYTGLNDKNDKEIYEGDFVKMGGELFVIAYYGDTCSFGMRMGDYARRALYMPYKSDYEVIGNRYENPELAKEFYGN